MAKKKVTGGHRKSATRHKKKTTARATKKHHHKSHTKKKKSSTRHAKKEHSSGSARKILEQYTFKAQTIPITIKIYHDPNEYVPIYEVTISSISHHTEIILEKIREELIKEVNLGMVEIRDLKQSHIAESRFRTTIIDLINKYFPELEATTREFLVSYLIQKSLGLGSVEILIADPYLEEIALNSSDDPVWVYHRKHAWVKTNIRLSNEDQTKHYASMIGRKVGRQITTLAPLMDATLTTGHRVNATLMPISNKGNTITLRKFASKPWTITDFLTSKTMSAEAAGFIWTGLQYELSALIAGGTATGKTSTLNVIANFFPPNQRIISIEDTREIRLPKFLHWVPMVTRQPNNEGKGEVSMLDLLVNSLRQRPDRILVGEIRRKREAETLFEAIHTGHSVYATVHANDTKETITRLTSPPIEVPASMVPAISMLIVQYRNRRTGLRRTFEVSEINPDASPNVIMRYDARRDILGKVSKSKRILNTLHTYTGLSNHEITRNINEKVKVLKWMVKQKINDVDSVGQIVANYYTQEKELLKMVTKNKPFKGIGNGKETVQKDSGRDAGPRA